MIYLFSLESDSHSDTGQTVETVWKACLVQKKKKTGKLLKTSPEKSVTQNME